MPRLRTQFVLFCLLFTHPCFPQTAAPTLADRGPASATEQVRLSEILISTPQPYDPAQGARIATRSLITDQVLRSTSARKRLRARGSPNTRRFADAAWLAMACMRIGRLRKR